MKIPWRYIFYWLLGGVLLSIISLELTLRFKYGLGNPALMIVDEQIGYRFKPNQEVTRFGKRMAYNEYSQRSESFSIEKPKDKLRILMIGDSVLNGGYPSDQTETITAFLTEKLATKGYQAEILNASAGSWGIGNQLAYLKKFGIFDSDMIILQIGTHDLIQPTSTSEKVGNDPYFPATKPFSAIGEGWERYGKRFVIFWLWGYHKISVAKYLEEPEIPPQLNPTVDFPKNMGYLKEILTIAKNKNIPIYVLFTPYRDDLLVKKDLPSYYTEFLAVLKEQNVTVIDSYAYWKVFPKSLPSNYFRDSVHLTVTGNLAIANLLFEKLWGNKIKN